MRIAFVFACSARDAQGELLLGKCFRRARLKRHVTDRSVKKADVDYIDNYSLLHLGVRELTEQRARMRGIESRVGKPDPQLATAMARAGTRSRDMVECGLSHGEVHLLQALNSARSGQPQAAVATG